MASERGYAVVRLAGQRNPVARRPVAARAAPQLFTSRCYPLLLYLLARLVGKRPNGRGTYIATLSDVPPKAFKPLNDTSLCM